MLVDGILERNRAFVSRREARPLPPVATKPLAVVACYDPRLDPLILPALGLEHGEAFLLRTAGALVLPGGGVMRSLGLAVFMFGAREILVLGHTSCRMATFDNSEFIDMFRARGVPRDAFGTDDLRQWAGAIPNPTSGVRISVENISRAPFLPRDVVVSGAVLDDTTGEIELVVRGGQQFGSVAPVAEPPPVEAATAPAAPEATHGTHIHAEPTPTTHEDSSPLVGAIVDFVGKVERQGKWRAETRELRQHLARTRSPLARFRLLEAYLHKVKGESKDLAVALERMKSEIEHAEGRVPGHLAQWLEKWSG